MRPGNGAETVQGFNDELKRGGGGGGGGAKEELRWIDVGSESSFSPITTPCRVVQG